MPPVFRILVLTIGLMSLALAGARAAEPAPAEAAAPAEASAEPMILTATLAGVDMDQAVAALHRAVTSHNYTFVRQQAIDSRLVPYAQEVRSVRLYYFCNFDKMDRALRVDPRAAQMLPCRVTLVETPTGVDLMAVNPAWLTQSMDNPDLHAMCLDLKRDYLAILDEAAL
jgi:uncharacterized protein (DUF302 family)